MHEQALDYISMFELIFWFFEECSDGRRFFGDNFAFLCMSFTCTNGKGKFSVNNTKN